MFVGDDIRSLNLTIKYANENNIDIYANYYELQNPYFLSNEYDL